MRHKPARLEILAVIVGVLVPNLAAPAWGQVCDLKPDEQILFFPAFAFRTPGQGHWQAELRGCVFEPEKRGASLAILQRGLEYKGVKISDAEQVVLRERARLFLVDNERGKRVVVRAGDTLFDLGKSEADGTFSGTVRWPANATARTTALTFEAVLSPGDSRRFLATVFLVEETGMTVVTDIDDTIKITCVRDRSEMLRKSFLEPFQPVPGMAALFSSCGQDPGAQFFYVSASPWQFYSPLAEFVASNSFPRGVFGLKTVRWKDRSLLDLFANPKSYKLRSIEPLLERFPARRFVLVGDSGESDPEVYGLLARRHPGQIGRILIRDVTNEPEDARRYEEAFRGLAPDLWEVFRDPGAVKSL